MVWLKEKKKEKKKKRQNTKHWVLLSNRQNQFFASSGLVLNVHLVVKVVLLNIYIIFLQQIFGGKLLMILIWTHHWDFFSPLILAIMTCHLKFIVKILGT